MNDLPDIKDLKKRWELLLPKSDWYLEILPEINSIQKQLEKEKGKIGDSYKKEIYDFFELHLKNHDIALEDDSENMEDMDIQRKPIDTIIIHHTSNLPGMTPDRLSAIELIRLYAPYFYNPTYENEKHLKGKPIYSGHTRNGEQVFWPYHWFVRRSGVAERLLEDREIGWQAGNWEINCRSVAICFDNDYESSKPSDEELKATTKLIQEHYHTVPKERIFGHREINPKTTCPSNLFLDMPEKNGWKTDLLNLI